MTKQHCATGNPRGQPPRIPFDMDQKILDALRRRVNSSTGLVRPDWKGLARTQTAGRSMLGGYGHYGLDRLQLVGAGR